MDFSGALFREIEGDGDLPGPHHGNGGPHVVEKPGVEEGYTVLGQRIRIKVTADARFDDVHNIGLARFVQPNKIEAGHFGDDNVDVKDRKSTRLNSSHTVI